MVRQWQKLFWQKRYSATDLPDILDYVKLAGAVGLRGWEVDNAEDLRQAITEARDSGRGAVIACDIFVDENVWPIVPPGDAIDNQVIAE
jgi:acetolactate synthase-1/2/3 large subunit